MERGVAFDLLCSYGDARRFIRWQRQKFTASWTSQGWCHWAEREALRDLIRCTWHVRRALAQGDEDTARLRATEAKLCHEVLVRLAMYPLFNSGRKSSSAGAHGAEGAEARRTAQERHKTDVRTAFTRLRVAHPQRFDGELLKDVYAHFGGKVSRKSVKTFCEEEPSLLGQRKK